MLGPSLIGCHEDSKYFHTHTVDTERRTEQIHPGLIGQIGFCVLESKVISQVTRANKHWSGVKLELLIRIRQVCVEETQKSTPIVTVTFSVVLHTSGQLKHSERLSNTPQRFQRYCKGLRDKLLCCYGKSCRALMEYLRSMCCAGKRASCPELAF